jgi:hypothetical protein
MGKLDSECSELMNSIESNNETQSRERLFAATVKYVQSPGKASNEEKSAKVLLVLGMAVRGIYMDVRSKVLDLSSKPIRIFISKDGILITKDDQTVKYEKQTRPRVPKSK